MDLLVPAFLACIAASFIGVLQPPAGFRDGQFNTTWPSVLFFMFNAFAFYGSVCAILLIVPTENIRMSLLLKACLTGIALAYSLAGVAGAPRSGSYESYFKGLSIGGILAIAACLPGNHISATQYPKYLIGLFIVVVLSFAVWLAWDYLSQVVLSLAACLPWDYLTQSWDYITQFVLFLYQLF